MPFPAYKSAAKSWCMLRAGIPKCGKVPFCVYAGAVDCCFTHTGVRYFRNADRMPMCCIFSAVYRTAVKGLFGIPKCGRMPFCVYLSAVDCSFRYTRVLHFLRKRTKQVSILIANSGSAGQGGVTRGGQEAHSGIRPECAQLSLSIVVRKPAVYRTIISQRPDIIGRPYCGPAVRLGDDHRWLVTPTPAELVVCPETQAPRQLDELDNQSERGGHEREVGNCKPPSQHAEE